MDGVVRERVKTGLTSMLERPVSALRGVPFALPSL